MGTAAGFLTLVHEQVIKRTPRVHVVQPAGNNTIAGPLREGKEQGQNVNCTTLVSGLQVASVTDADGTITTCRETDGNGYLVEDDRVWKMQKRLAREEGIFCEPAAAVSVVGALEAIEAGEISADATVVCMITGSGFKDPGSVEKMVRDMSCPLIDADQVEATMGIET